MRTQRVERELCWRRILRVSFWGVECTGESSGSKTLQNPSLFRLETCAMKLSENGASFLRPYRAVIMSTVSSSVVIRRVRRW